MAITPVGIGRVDTCGRVAAAVAHADDDAPLLKTFADGVGETVHVILELFDRDNTWGAAATVSKNDMMLLKDVADGNMEVLVPTDVDTVDPACSARVGTPSSVCFDCSHPSIFESAF